MTNQIVNQFVRDIYEIEEDDYGDFMRSANVYLNSFRTEVERKGIYDLNKKIDEMKMYLQFAPNWDIESTRVRLVSDSKYLDDILSAHRQDWESASLP